MLEKICAGIVLYNPKIERLRENLDSISKQVDEIVLVDNNSNNRADEAKLFTHYNNTHILSNEKNLGIAIALNQVVSYARDKGFSWVLLLDQDSVAAEDFVYKFSLFMKDNRISIICPQIIDINIQKPQITGIEEIKCSTDIITSGSCIRVDDWYKLGGFDERLFIDFVDTDYQERCLRSGRKIVRNNDAHLYHEIGALEEKSFLGFKVLCSNHNPKRRYYMVRNRLFFRYKYYGKASFLKEYIRLLLGTFKIILFENKKAEKVDAFVKGVRHSKKLIREDKKTNSNIYKRINIILPAAFGTGGIKVLYEYGRRISSRGIKVTYYVPFIAYNMHRGNKVADLIKQIYATFKLFGEYYIKQRIKVIRREEQADIKIVFRINNKELENADVIMASAWVTAFDIEKLSNNKGEKYYFIQGYEVWDNEKLGRDSYSLPLKKIVISEWIKKKLVTECGCKGNEIVIVNNGIDTNKFNNTQKQYEGERCIECLMLDHKLRQKGTREGLEVFNKAKEVFPNIKLSMFGVSRTSEVPEWVEYYQDPNQDTLINLYRKADVFIFPSLEEGWGLTPIEAMACKCAVVGTKVGCMLDIGIDGENVMLSDPGDIDSMVKDLVAVLTNPELRKKISEEGYKTVQRLDWEKSVDQLLQSIGI